MVTWAGWYGGDDSLSTGGTNFCGGGCEIGMDGEVGFAGS